jgi:hypothetical protein
MRLIEREKNIEVRRDIDKEKDWIARNEIIVVENPSA